MTDMYETTVDLERDIDSCEWIKKKVRESDTYAQNLYAAFCNTLWTKNSFIPTLSGDNTWSCSWRGAGSIIARLQGKGDYMDWYCSGMGGVAFYDSEEGNKYMDDNKYVPEGTITIEIITDLATLGWRGTNRDQAE